MGTVETCWGTGWWRGGEWAGGGWYVPRCIVREVWVGERFWVLGLGLFG
jgi:hypothetical protein